MIFSGLFNKERISTQPDVRSYERIMAVGTPTRATVTDVLRKRTGWVVVAVYEDRWLGTQEMYTSRILTQKPDAFVGGEVTVYVDDASGTGDYYMDVG